MPAILPRDEPVMSKPRHGEAAGCIGRAGMRAHGEQPNARGPGQFKKNHRTGIVHDGNTSRPS